MVEGKSIQFSANRKIVLKHGSIIMYANGDTNNLCLMLQIMLQSVISIYHLPDYAKQVVGCISCHTSKILNRLCRNPWSRRISILSKSLRSHIIGPATSIRHKPRFSAMPNAKRPKMRATKPGTPNGFQCR